MHEVKGFVDGNGGLEFQVVYYKRHLTAHHCDTKGSGACSKGGHARVDYINMILYLSITLSCQKSAGTRYTLPFVWQPLVVSKCFTCLGFLQHFIIVRFVEGVAPPFL